MGDRLISTGTAEASKPIQPNWTIIGLIAVVVAFLFFQPFFGTICIAALMAFLFSPLHRRFSKHMPESISAILILIISSLIFIIPIIFITIIAINQSISLANTLQHLSVQPGSTLFKLSGSAVSKINEVLAPFVGNSHAINSNSIVNIAHEVIPKLITSIGNVVLGFLSNLPKLFTSTIVYLFLFMAFLRHNKSIVRLAKSISPFEDNQNDKFFEKSGLIVTASLRGQFIISISTAISSAILLGFTLGLWPFFMLFVIIFTLLGMVPLGSGIVVIPIGIIAMITGDFWGGFWCLLIYLTVVCNIDSVLRPHLIPKKANLIPAVTTLATFCGIFYFGTLGIVYGPLIVILLMTTIDIYTSTHPRNLAKT